MLLWVVLCRVFQESISVTMRGILRAGSLLRYGDISGQNLCYYEGYFRTGSVILEVFQGRISVTFGYIFHSRTYVTTRWVFQGRICSLGREGSRSEGDGECLDVARENFDCIQRW